MDLAADVCGGASRLRMLHLLDAVASTGNDGYGFDCGGLCPGGVEVRHVEEMAQTFLKLFASVLPAGSVFDRLIAKYHAGVRGDKTLHLLKAGP